MKQLFKLLVGCMLMMAWPLVITSCEGAFDDIFGEWSRPTGQQNNEPTKEEVLDNLSSALEEGAVITITYALDGVKYTSTMKKQGDEFIELSAAEAATRAMTRGLEIPVCSGIELKNKINWKFYQGKQLKLDVSIMKENCETITNYASSGSEIVGVGVNGQQANLKKSSDNFTLAIVKEEGSNLITVASFDVIEGDTWDSFTNRINGLCYDCFDIKKTGIIFNDPSSGCRGIIYNGDNKKVLIGDKIDKSQTYYMQELVSVTCTERSWDETNNKVETSDKTFNDCKVVLSSDESVKWEAGTYVVNHDVTIGGEISFDGDINLILCDDCSLTVKGMIQGNEKSFTIYGQAAGSGKLIQKKYEFGLCNFTDLVIHGSNIEMENNSNLKFSLKMYGGKFTARSYNTYPIIDLMLYYNNITIYGGELEAVNDAVDAIIVGSDANPGTLTVYGGKVTASAPKGQAIIGKFARGEGVTDIVFSESDNGTDWTEITAGTSSKKYFKAEEGVPAYVPTDEEISALYAKLGEDMDITADMVSEWIITTLVGDIVSTAEAVTETYAKPLAEKICTEKSLTSVVLYMGGKDASGYDFYAISGSSKGVVHLASDAAIPAAWSGLKIFYVAKPKE